jgi:hypothetical protein
MAVGCLVPATASELMAPKATLELTSDGENPAKVNEASWDWSNRGKDQEATLGPGWAVGAVLAPMSIVSYAGVGWKSQEDVDGVKSCWPLGSVSDRDDAWAEASVTAAGAFMKPNAESSNSKRPAAPSLAMTVLAGGVLTDEIARGNLSSCRAAGGRRQSCRAPGQGCWADALQFPAEGNGSSRQMSSAPAIQRRGRRARCKQTRRKVLSGEAETRWVVSGVLVVWNRMTVGLQSFDLEPRRGRVSPLSTNGNSALHAAAPYLLMQLQGNRTTPTRCALLGIQKQEQVLTVIN